MKYEISITDENGRECIAASMKTDQEQGFDLWASMMVRMIKAMPVKQNDYATLLLIQTENDAPENYSFIEDA